jgi:hypothetical protein
VFQGSKTGTYGIEIIEHVLGHLRKSNNDAIDGSVLVTVFVVGGDRNILEDSDGGERVH